VTDLTPDQIVTALLTAANIKRVISVDDNYNFLPDVAEIQGQVQTMELEFIRSRLNSGGFGMLFSEDPETLSDRVRNFWATKTATDKVALLQALGILKRGEVATMDAIALSRLPALFSSVDFQPMGLPEWRAAKDSVIQRSKKERTLILFDEDLSKQGGSQDEGLTLAKEVLASETGSDLIACLVSYKYELNDLHYRSKDLAASHSLPEHQFTLIPKKLLTQKDSALEFAGLVKLTVVTKSYSALIEQARKIFVDSVKEAGDEIRGMTIYDLNQIIFQSSYREGVWEPDTLFRLLEIFHRGKNQTRAFNDGVLRQASAEIRHIGAIPTPSFRPSSSTDVLRVQHMENYEDAERLNSLHRPTELGDIYENTESHDKYILIAPQCDLMVRSEGYRGDKQDILTQGVLAQIIPGKPTDGALGWRLDFYTEGEDHFVDFKKTVIVRLADLDLCVFNTSGVAAFTANEEPSSLLIPAWEKRHSFINKHINSVMDTYRRIAPTQQQNGEISRLLTQSDRSSLFPGNINPESGRMEYALKRVMRLLTPRSTALISAYAKFLDRDAFEHTFS
jgi:hypothetical protein